MAMRPPARRRTRLDLVALVVTLVCVAVAGWALLGLASGPVPEVEDFGEAAAVVSPDGPDSTMTPDSVIAPTKGPEPQPPVDTGPALTPPERRSASVSDRPHPGPAPVRLRVPEVGLDVPVDPVGVADDGQMEIPADADRAGWYRFGPAPGEEAGSVVVAAHVDDRSGPGAFLALADAEEGHEILVDLADGTTTAYRVTGRTTVAKPELAVDTLFRRDGDPQLHLVTCAGEWSRQTGRYTDNLVVTAEPVG